MQLVSKIFNLCGHDPRTLQTNRQTTCDLDTALCTVVHHAVKILKTIIMRQEFLFKVKVYFLQTGWN